MKTLKYYPPLFHFRLTQSKWWLIGGLLAIFSLGIHAEDKLNNRLGIPFKAPEPTGATRLIIGLKVPTQPEGELSGTQSVAEQRNAIEFAKTQFLSELKQSLEVDGLSGAASTVEVKKQFKTIPYLVMEVNPAILSKIEENSQVADVAVDEIHPPTLSDSTVLIGADDVWEQGYTGSGQVVAVLDTGVDKTHPALRGKIVKEACYSTTSTSYEASTVCPNGEESEEGNGAGVACDSSVTGCDHGTHVAGIIAANGSVNGVAKDAQLIAIQVFSRFDNPNYCLGSDSLCFEFYLRSNRCFRIRLSIT
jgi:subtilisin